MINLVSEPERAYRLAVHKATRPGNRTLNRKTQPNQRAYVTRLGYSTICTSYTTGTEIGRLSGSSLNRAESKRQKDELKRIYQEKEEIEEKVGRFDPEYIQWIREIRAIRSIAAGKQGLRKRVPPTLSKRGYPVHFLSQRSKGKVRDKFTALHRCLGKQSVFATLTFINDVDDRLAVSCWNKFVTQLRKDFGKINFIWVAERQGNGRVHFHVILSKRLPVQRYNALWVLQQYNAGIEAEGISYQQVNDYIRGGTLQKHLNPFDVKQIRHINGLSYYLTKYVTKNQSAGFECLAWHCSRPVSRLFTKTIATRSTFQAAASFANARVDFKTGEVKKHPGIASAFYQLFYIENKSFFLPEMSEIEMVNRWIASGMEIDRIPIIDDQGIFKFYSN